MALENFTGCILPKGTISSHLAIRLRHRHILIPTTSLATFSSSLSSCPLHRPTVSPPRVCPPPSQPHPFDRPVSRSPLSPASRPPTVRHLRSPRISVAAPAPI